MALADTMQQLNEFDINDIDFDRVGTWPLAGKAFTWVLAFSLILVGVYFGFIKDQNALVEKEAAEEATLRTSYQEKAFQAANLPAYKEQMKEMQSTFDALLSQLPEDTEVPGLLEDITERGTDAGLNILSISLQPEATKDFFIELPISISVEGNYHDFGTFVSGVSALPRIVTLHDYEILTKEDGLLSMTIQARTYRYKTTE